MSTTDPARRSTLRTVRAGLVFALALVAAGFSGDGWAIDAYPTSEQGVHAVLILVGGLAAVLLTVAAAFLAPGALLRRHTGVLVTAGLGLLAGAYAVGLWIGWRRVPAGASEQFGVSPPGRVLDEALGAAVVALLLLLASGVLRWLQDRHADVRAEVVGGGARASGEVTAVERAGYVNYTPRWRITVRFTDAAGADRWVVEHHLGWDEPVAGQAVIVHFDPRRPGARGRIFLDL